MRVLNFPSPSASKYLVVQGYAIFNGRFGFRATEGLSVNFGVETLNKITLSNYYQLEEMLTLCWCFRRPKNLNYLEVFV
jgi:hypothetical protein